MARLIRFDERELLNLVEDNVRDYTRAVFVEAVRTCPVGPSSSRRRDGSRPGRLRDSLDWEVERRASRVIGTVGTSLEYALYVHEGRGPVRARAGSVLGPLPTPYPAFVRRVGPADGNPWLLRALQRAQPFPVTREG